MVNTVGPSKTSGHWHSMKGGFKETVGNLTGMRGLARSGANERAAGKGQLQAAKGAGYMQGTKERVVGKTDQVMGAATGDYSREQAGKARGMKGERQQAWNRAN